MFFTVLGYIWAIYKHRYRKLYKYIGFIAKCLIIAINIHCTMGAHYKEFKYTVNLHVGERIIFY